MKTKLLTSALIILFIALPLSLCRSQGWTKADYGSSYKNRLYLSIEDDDVDVVKEYLDNGWEIESRNGLLDQTILAKAASVGAYNVVKCLIEQGADVNSMSYNGIIPIMDAIPFPGAPAAYNSRKKKVFLLLLKNPKTNIFYRNSAGLNILDIVKIHENGELIEAVNAEFKRRNKNK